MPTHPPFHADRGLNGTWTWAAVFAGVTVVVTVVGVSVTIVHHRRDKLAQLLEPVDILLDDTAVALDKPATLSATKNDMAGLRELRLRIKQAEKTFPWIQLGDVVSAIEAYEQTALPDDFAQKLTEGASAAILQLSREQGAGVEAVRTAIDGVQGIIKRLRRR